MALIVTESLELWYCCARPDDRWWATMCSHFSRWIKYFSCFLSVVCLQFNLFTASISRSVHNIYYDRSHVIMCLKRKKSLRLSDRTGGDFSRTRSENRVSRNTRDFFCFLQISFQNTTNTNAHPCEKVFFDLQTRWIFNAILRGSAYVSCFQSDDTTMAVNDYSGFRKLTLTRIVFWQLQVHSSLGCIQYDMYSLPQIPSFRKQSRLVWTHNSTTR